MINGSQFDRTFRSGESFESAPLDSRDMQYLYLDESGYVFMDSKTFEQVSIEGDTLGIDRYFLVDNMDVEILMFGEAGIGITLPIFVNMRVSQSDPWVKGIPHLETINRRQLRPDTR